MGPRGDEVAVSSAYEELDYRKTPQGDLILRRRRALSLGGADVYEVTLDGEFLMSSLVDAPERALATIPLSTMGDRAVDVLVGGLGLGATAHAALAFEHVRSLTVVERAPAVIDWHRRGLVPLAADIEHDPRTRLVEADFFHLFTGDPARKGLPLATDVFTAILVDIDHSPTSLLHPSHAAFYETRGLQEVASRLEPGGAFALWSADPPDGEFLEKMGEVFESVRAEEVNFSNPLLDVEDANTIYLGTRGP
jgi:spermidine synthase